MTSKITFSALSALILILSASISRAQLPALSHEDKAWIGNQIFNNECNRQARCLTSWNEGERFPSLGIGHFIWFRNNQIEPFEESFPQLLQYFLDQGVRLPEWLNSLSERDAADYDAPWTDRSQFMAELDGERLTILRTFLHQHMEVQTEFIIRRLYASLPQMLESVPSGRRADLESVFYRVANSQQPGQRPYGLYALIDYVNFKGEGVSASERYRGQGWGLLQVLEHLLAAEEVSGEESGILEEFARSASAILSRRVENAPAERREERWLNGWDNRLRTYVPPQN